jgi:hypothetical protein
MIFTADVPARHEGSQSSIVIRDDRGVAAAELILQDLVDNAEEAESLLQNAGWPPTAAGTETDQGWAFPVTRAHTGTEG